MPSKRFALITTAALAATLATNAFAGPTCTAEPQNKWLTDKQMTEKFTGQGMRDDVKKLHVSKGNCWEIYGHDKAGRKIEVYFHSITGEIVEQNVKQ
jgi:hypothetical protein